MVGEEENSISRSALVLERSFCSLARRCLPKKNEKKIKHTSVYRLGLYGIFPGNFKFGARHFLNGFKLKLFNFNSE